MASPSPRDIPEFLEAIGKIEEDRFFCKYMPEKFAYDTIYDVFSTHKEYTHLVIWPDDLIVTPEQFDLLKRDARNYYPVIGGYFNRNWQDRELMSVVTAHPNHKWKTEQEISDWVVSKGGDPVIQVAQDYFGCTFIKRWVLEKIGAFRGVPNSSFDYGFSLDCMKHGIPMHIDTRVKLVHLSNRKGDGTQECCGVGVKKPYWKWVKANE